MIAFISDLHLSPDVPAIARLFLRFLAEFQGQHLFILGDLFEFWHGDDSFDAPENHLEREVARALRALGARGVRLSALRGNRDFLLRQGFSERTGVELLPDVFELHLANKSFVLAHGDALCTANVRYQAYRAKTRSAFLPWFYLHLPLWLRMAIARRVRQKSEAGKKALTGSPQAYLMDLTPEAIDTFLREHHYATFIHGHTHMPATHIHKVDGHTIERWVLSDWREADGHASGDALVWDGTRLQRTALSTRRA